MKKTINTVFSVLAASLIFISCATSADTEKKADPYMINTVSNFMSKNINNNNPLLPNFYCADPTAVVYEGRLYVIGTNDHQMYENLKEGEDVNYGYINTLAVMSTDDMANWTFHGEIKVSQVARWAGNAWAPSIASRVEEDGLTHFYLYFANGGNGIGVLTATSPLGPWKDPIGKALISRGVKGLGKCDWLFDPGVCIDDKGVGYIAFGGGPGHDNCKIARLGKDMVSLDMETGIVALPKTPNHFEANELNYINGKYILSYCSAWDIQPAAQICYMVSETPLDAESWVNGGAYFDNIAAFGLGGGNNHSHFEKFKDKYYFIYQAHDLHTVFNVKGDCRNINIDELKVDEETGKISACRGTKKGVDQIANPSVTVETGFETLSTGSGFKYVKGKDRISVKATTKETIGGWTMLKKAELSSVSKIKVTAKGQGTLNVYLDSLKISDVTPLASLKIDSADFSEVSAKLNEYTAGLHDIYFVFSNGLELDSWIME